MADLMKAIWFTGDGGVEVRATPMPVASNGEVVVRVHASGICRSDMSLYRGASLLRKGSGLVIPGHEVMGTVEAIGTGCRRLSGGERVAIYLALGCGDCFECLRGYWMLCPEWRCLGFDVNGGDAQYVVIPERNCIVLPDSISDSGGVVLTDMVGTQYEAQRTVGVSGASTVIVFGLGPMGCAAVMVAKALGAMVIGVDPIVARRNRALSLGAVEVTGPEEVDGQIGKGWPGQVIDVAIECSGTESAEQSALKCIRHEGDVVLVGERNNLELDPSNDLIRKLVRLRGAWYFPRWRGEELVVFALKHSLPLDGLVSDIVPFDMAGDAFARFEERKVEKVVLVPE